MLYELWKRVARPAIAALVIIIATVLAEELAKAIDDQEPDDGSQSGEKV